MKTSLLLLIFAQAYFLYAWLNTQLPVHFFQILRKTIWPKREASFWVWDSVDLSNMTRRDWNDWVGMVFATDPTLEKTAKILADLLTCRICLAFHVALWTTFVTVCCWHYPWSWFIPLWWAGPFPTLCLVKLLEKV